MRRLNLESKFAVVTGAMLLAVASIITAFLTKQQEAVIRDELLSRAVALTENLAYNCQLPLAAENKTSLQRLAQGLFKSGEVSYVQFQNTDGVDLLHRGEIRGPDFKVVHVIGAREHESGIRSAWMRTAAGRTYLDVQCPVVVEANEDDILAFGQKSETTALGRVRVGVTTAGAERRIAQARFLAGLIALGAALAGSLLAAGLIHVLTRPLGRLMEGNRRLARGDYTLRLQVRTDDEFGRLSTSYNQMADEIQRSRDLADSYLASLRANAEHLEEANRALQVSNAELAKASRMKSEFLAVMSHELRTPLNVIIGFSEVLLDQTFGQLNGKQSRYATNILTSGRHLLTLINDILDLSKVEAGRMQVAPEPFDLGQCLDEIQSLVKNLAAKKGVDIHCAAVPALTPITDQKLFKQVMFNLLSNAIKFTPAGGRIDLAVRAVDGAVLRADAIAQWLPFERRDFITTGRKLVVEVHDTGIGIAPEEHDKIFQAFRQVDASYARKQEGTGLGLALTRKIVQLLNGEIWFHSVPKEGSRFWFYVPFEHEDESRELGPKSMPRAIDRLVDADADARVAARGRSEPAADPGGDAQRPAALADWPWGEAPAVAPAKAPATPARTREEVA
jgi:signal transduction histidine kinase